MVSPSGTHWPVFRGLKLPPLQPFTPSAHCPPCLGPGSALAPTFWLWIDILMQSSVMFSQVVVAERALVTEPMLHSL